MNVVSASNLKFQGYTRASGPPGVRNKLLILNITGLSEPTSRRIHNALPGSMFASTPYGAGMLGSDALAHIETLVGLASHPNAGAVLVLSADRPHCDIITNALTEIGKPFHAIAYDDVCYDNLRMTDQGIRAAAGLTADLSRHRPTSQPLSDLVIGMECGLSDPTSGLAANPLIGRFSDLMIAVGGTVILGETLEWLGVEDRLADRASTPEVAAKITEAVLRRERMAQEAGIDLTGNNPNQANIESGLTTIEEKASGSSAKSGSAVISGVLRYSERPAQPGLYLMDAPSCSPESLTGFVASGAQLMIFSTGLGNSYTSALAPTIKISANKFTAESLPQQIDFDCSTLLAGGDPNLETIRLTEHVLEIASGALTYGEILAEGSETISRFGASL